MKQLACGSLVPNCSVVFNGADEAEILRQVAVHAREAHGIGDLSTAFEQQVRESIVDV